MALMVAALSSVSDVSAEIRHRPFSALLFPPVQTLVKSFEATELPGEACTVHETRHMSPQTAVIALQIEHGRAR